MYRNIKRKLVIASSFLYLLPVSFVFSQGEGKGGIKLKNPIGATAKDIPSLLASILKLVVMIGLPVITLAIIYAGFKFVAARGNSTKIEEAKTTLLYVVIGAAIILGAEVLKDLIQATAGKLL